MLAISNHNPALPFEPKAGVSDLTVILCTRNGEPTLGAVLDGYLAQHTRGFTWDMVIVNNGSTDGTAALVRRYQSQLPITLLDEPIPGKNRALNRGLARVATAFIVMTDDDAVPSPDFLQAWWETAQHMSDHDLFGGRIEPDFASPPPAWVQHTGYICASLFAKRDLPEGPMIATDIFGPNMAIRRRLLDAGMAFNEAIGPNGADPNYVTGSETEFCRRAAAAGHRAYFARGPLVHHIVRPHQLQPDFWWTRAFRNGRGNARILRGDRQSTSALKVKALQVLAAVGQGSLWVHSVLCPYHPSRQRARWLFHWLRGFRHG